MSSAAEHTYLGVGEPFHVTEDGFRVWEGAREGRFICSSPGYATYRGDMVGVVRFIERMRLEFAR